METIWADWKVVRLLGEGSFGKVYEVVRDRFGIEERSAVKVISLPSTPSEANSLRSEGMTDDDITIYYKGLVQDFVQEIALMSKLRGHANIVGYEDYEVIEHKDGFGWDIYIRMELLTPLTSRMVDSNKQPLSLSEEEVRDMAIDLCAALEACADHRIVHRDIKPDNIFISKTGDYKLGDFGVAKTIDKTVSGLSKKGTYTYMAPEIYKGEPGGLNSDLYSLGIVLYRLLNDGREPFAPPVPQPVSYAQKQEALAMRMRGDAFPPPAHASAAMFDIIKKACAYNPRDRYQNAAQMRADLRDLAFKAAAAVKPVQPVVQVITNDPGAVSVTAPTPPAPHQAPVAPSYAPPVYQPPMPQPKKKNTALKFVLIALLVLFIIGAVSVGIVLLSESDLFGGGTSTSDKAEEEKTQKTSSDGYATPQEAIEAFADFCFDPTTDIIKRSIPDEFEAIAEDTYGVAVDDAFITYMGSGSPSYKPTNLKITDTVEITPSDSAVALLENCNIDPNDVTWYACPATWDDQTSTDETDTFTVFRYNDAYYCYRAVEAFVDIVNDLKAENQTAEYGY